ncbi:hypothetical protein HMPREF3229_01786, partial [Peptoniphilus harei]
TQRTWGEGGGFEGQGASRCPYAPPREHSKALLYKTQLNIKSLYRIIKASALKKIFTISALLSILLKLY